MPLCLLRYMTRIWERLEKDHQERSWAERVLSASNVEDVFR